MHQNHHQYQRQYKALRQIYPNPLQPHCHQRVNLSPTRQQGSFDMERRGGCTGARRGILLSYRTANERNRTRRVKWPDMDTRQDTRPLASPTVPPKGLIEETVDDVFETIQMACGGRGYHVPPPTKQSLTSIPQGSDLMERYGRLTVKTDLPLEPEAPFPNDPVVAFRQKNSVREEMLAETMEDDRGDDYYYEDDENSIQDDGDDWAPKQTRQEEKVLRGDPVVQARLHPAQGQQLASIYREEDAWNKTPRTANVYPKHERIVSISRYVEEDWDEAPREPPAHMQSSWQEAPASQHSYEPYVQRHESRAAASLQQDYLQQLAEQQLSHSKQDSHQKKKSSPRKGLLGWRRSKKDKKKTKEEEGHFAEIHWSESRRTAAPVPKPVRRCPIDPRHVGEINWTTHEGKKVDKMKHHKEPPYVNRTVEEFIHAPEIEEWEREIKMAYKRIEALDFVNDESSDSDIGDKYKRAPRQKNPRGRQDWGLKPGEYE